MGVHAVARLSHNSEYQPMNAMNRFHSTMRSLATVLLISISCLNVLGESPIRVQTVNETQTSWVPRVITNFIEVRMPTNIFINVYRTNQIEVVRSNVVNVYQTNWTDWTETRVVPVDLTRTNYVTRYHTNLNTLTFTNWETVLVMKTNRVTQRVPNVVEIGLPAERAETITKTTSSTKASAPVTPAVASSATLDGLALDTTTTGKATVNNMIEVQFKLKSTDGAIPKLTSYEWRVERTDGSVLLFGQESEFKREVPIGTYRIEVKARAGKTSPYVRVRGVVEVTESAAIQQTPSLGASQR